MKEDLSKLPRIHPKYGGILTFYKDLPVGTQFYVANGEWDGEVVEIDGVKKCMSIIQGNIMMLRKKVLHG